MFGDILQPTHLLLILLVALLVLGPKRLPEVGRSLGKGLRDFRGAMAGIEEHTSNLLGSDEQDSPAEAPSMPVQSPVAEATAPAVAQTAGAVPVATASTAPGPPTSSAPARQDSEPDPSEYAD